MERSGVKQSIVVVVCLVLGLLMGAHRSEAVDVSTCYWNCFNVCIVTPGKTMYMCAVKCLRECIHPPSLSSLGPADAESFCKLGCSMSRCSHLSTKTDARENEVSDCVDSCSRMCSKKN